jgi:hypothetical protein
MGLISWWNTTTTSFIQYIPIGFHCKCIYWFIVKFPSLEQSWIVIGHVQRGNSGLLNWIYLPLSILQVHPFHILIINFVNLNYL